MKKSDVISYFGSAAEVACLLNVTPSAISQWPDQIPRLRAYELERLTNGALTVKPESIPQASEASRLSVVVLPEKAA